MSVTINVGGPGGVGGTGGAGGGFEQKPPSQMEAGEIVNELVKGNPDPERKKALEEELDRKLGKTGPGNENGGSGGPSGAGGAGGGNDASAAGGDAESIAELIEKLKNGTISRAELEKLGQALGMDPEALAKMNPKVAENLKENEGDVVGG